MPVSGFQGLVNGWIKVNSKHVASKHDTDESGDVRVQKRSSLKSEGDHTGHVSATSNSSKDSESLAIKRFNKRRTSRKLERTVSLTDLLREMAAEKEAEQKLLKDSAKAFSGSQSTAKRAPQSAAPDKKVAAAHPVDHAPVMLKDETHEDSSLRFVASFFGGDTPLLPHSVSSKGEDTKQPPMWHSRTSTGATTQNHVLHPTHGKQQQSPRQVHRRTGSNGVSEGSPSRPNAIHRSDSLSSKGEDSHNNPLAPPSSLRTTQSLHPPKQPPQNPMQQFFKHFPNPGGKRCSFCEEYENRYHAMAADMEYLRAVALRNEYVCRECQNEESSLHSKESALRLADASTRLAEIEKQHQEQIEDMTRQWSQWQIEMYSKLSKFASIAKDLDEQSRLRNKEEIKTDEELRQVKAERDALAMEVEKLRAALAHHDMERKEHQMIKETVAKYESEGLQRAREAIAQRDSVIRDLTSRLRKALETIDLERRKQAQRRQIIFPQRGSLPTPSSFAPGWSGNVEVLPRGDLEQANERARVAEIRLENAQAVAARSDAAYRARIAELEAKLSAAES